jgi:hypothetical protein
MKTAAIGGVAAGPLYGRTRNNNGVQTLANWANLGLVPQAPASTLGCPTSNDSRLIRAGACAGEDQPGAMSWYLAVDPAFTQVRIRQGTVNPRPL